MTATQFNQKLQDAGIHFTEVTKAKDNAFIGRLGFFYRKGNSSSAIADKVKAAGFDVMDHGEKFTAFIGGAPVAKQSHWWVKIKA